MEPHGLSTFGTALRRERLRGGWTQEELADRAKISVQAVGSLERGTRQVPRLTTLRRLAEALELPEDRRADFLAAARVEGLHASSSPHLPAQQQLIPSYPLTVDGAFVGRDLELHTILRLVAAHHGDATVDGDRETGLRLVLVAAEAGMGKTRLLAEVAQRSRELGALTLAGGCYELEGRLPYGPIRDALLDYVRVQSPASLHAHLGDLLPDLGRIMPEVEGRNGRSAQPQRHDADSERTRLFSAVAQTLERISGDRTCVLLIDDLH